MSMREMRCGVAAALVLFAQMVLAQEVLAQEVFAQEVLAQTALAETAVADSALADDAPGGALGTGLAPALGTPAPEGFESVASPDGSGLPVGQGAAGAGKMLYAQHCAACHGAEGRQSGNELVGGQGSLGTARPLKTVGSYWPYATTLFDYIQRAMPYGNEKSLSADETYAITAWVLHLNGIVEEDAVLDGPGLAAVRMPNADGFVELWSATLREQDRRTSDPAGAEP